MIVSYRVLGDPRPKGSKTTGITKSGARYVRESNPHTMTWVDAVKVESKRVMGFEEQGHHIRPPFNSPVKVRLRLYFKRPKGHYTSKGDLKWWAPFWKQTSPDIDKCARACLDGMQPWVIKDDAQVATLEVLKLYCPLGMEPGVHIEIRELA